MASAQQSIKTMMEPVVGEPVVRALVVLSSRAHSSATMLLRLGQRAAGAGGLNAQLGLSNFAVVTATRVVLVRGVQAPFETFGDWPRASVTGTAVRKHLTDNGGQGGHDFSQWMLRTTLQTPDGPVTFDMDEEHGGRPMLKALGVELPPLKPKTWWRSRPFD